jgi:hypothetical protein
VYEASKKYGITELESLAHQYIQRFRDGLTLSEILRESTDMFLKDPEDKTWFPNFIKGELQRILGSSELACSLHELYGGLGQNDRFDNIVFKMVVEILHVRLRSMSKDGKSFAI